MSAVGTQFEHVITLTLKNYSVSVILLREDMHLLSLGLWPCILSSPSKPNLAMCPFAVMGPSPIYN